MRKPRRKNAARTISADVMSELAEAVVPTHAAHIAQGYTLGEKTRLWLRTDGSLTGRFVYRSPDHSVSITHVVRGIRRAGVEAS